MFIYVVVVDESIVLVLVVFDVVVVVDMVHWFGFLDYFFFLIF